jgi:hypothetical protein
MAASPDRVLTLSSLREESEMEHPIGPSRITIDFRDAINPSRGWIVGVADGRSRVELLAFEGAPERLAPAPSLPVLALQADCTCPEFCERDHANE